MKKFTTLLFALTVATCYSQDRNAFTTSGTGEFSYSTAINHNSAGLWVSGAKDPGVEGTPYLFKNWKTLATIHTGKGKQYTITNLNYDTKINRFVSKVSIDSVFVFEPSDLKEAILNDRKFKRYYVNNAHDYYQVIASSNGKEVLKKNVKVLKRGKKDPLTTKKTKDKYFLRTTYFLNSKEGMQPLKLKKKSFFKIFGDKSSEIKKYAKENNLSFRRDTDIAKIFKFYDKL